MGSKELDKLAVWTAFRKVGESKRNGIPGTHKIQSCPRLLDLARCPSRADRKTLLPLCFTPLTC
jgi:hypothetical protein